MVIITTTVLLPKNFIGICFNNSYKTFYKNNKCHRYYRPAVIWYDDYKSWWFYSKFYGKSYEKYNQKQFIKDVSKQWLL